MKTKKLTTAVLLTLLAIWANYKISQNIDNQAVAYISQPPAGMTNAPSESNCTSCHSSFALTTNSSSITVSSTPTDIFANGYTPGSTYSITLTLSTGNPRYGFEITCLKANNTAAGTFAITNSSNTALQTSGGRQYVSHYNATSNHSWSFNWTAPTSGTGTVTFYSVGNFADSSNTYFGDHIHAKTFAVSEIVPTCNLTASITSSSAPNCNGGTDGSATVTPANGTSPYTYHWSNNGSTATVNNLAAGTASVTITDAASCTATASVTLGQPNLLTASISSTSVTINGQCNGSTTATPSGGTSPYTYHWSNNGSTATISSLCAGTYFVTVTDAHGCTILDTANILQPTAISATVTNSNVACNGDCNGSTSVTASGGIPPYSYVWNSSPSQTTATASNLCAGAYRVTVTDANGASIIKADTVFQPTALSATTSSTQASCGFSTGTATVTAHGGTSPYSYIWSTAPVQTTATATGLAAGGYDVTVTDAHNCTITTSVTVGSTGTLPGSAGTIAGGDTVCVGNSSYSVTNQSGVTYTWAVSGGGTVTPNGNSATINWTGTGTHTVSVTPSNNCGSSPASTLSVVVNAAPSSVPVITGDTTPCLGNATYSVTQQTGVTYAWAVSGGGTITPNGNSATINWTTNGAHTISVTPSNTCGAGTIGTLTANVGGNVPTSPSIVGNSSPCTGIAETYTVTAQTGITFAWAVTGGTVSPSTGTSVSITWSTTGNHSITVTPTGTCGAGTPGTLTVNASQGIVAAGNIAGSTAACSGSNITYTISPSNNGGSYTWAVSGGGTVTPNGDTAIVNWTSLGVFTLSVTPTSACGNGTPSTLSITVSGTPNVPTINGPSSFCANDTQLFRVTGLVGSTYNWSASGNAIINANLDSATISWPDSGTFTISVTNTNGCGTSSVGVKTITVKPLPSIDLGNDTTVCTPLTLRVNGSGISQYHWSNGSLDSITSIASSGNYQVTVTDNNGCTASDSKQVTINSVAMLNLNNEHGCDSVSVDAGANYASYLWSNGEHTEIINVTRSGSYGITVSSATGCTTSSSIYVRIDSMPVTGFSSIQDSNTVTLDGSATNVDHYFWDFGDGQTDTTANPTHTYTNNGTYTIVLYTSNGCGQDSVAHTLVINTVGLENLTDNHSLLVYPNPFTNYVTIVLQGDKGHLQVLNVMGKEIYEADIESNQPKTIDLSKVASGIYLIKVTGNRGTYNGKLQKN